MSFFANNQGELYALLTAVFWTITALATESASVKVGSLVVNMIRLLLAFFFLCIYSLFSRGLFFPVDASLYNWFWLIISGLIGFVLGDLFLFKSYTIIGSRYAMLVMALVPPITAVFSWLILNENISALSYLGMALTLLGIAMTVMTKKQNKKGLGLKLAPIGLLYAFGGALGQSLGLVFSKLGMKDYDPFAATQIRIIAGIVGFTIIVTSMRRWNIVAKALTNGPAMRGIAIGSFFGPFLGVSFSLLAIAYTATGIASTIMAIVPILIIPPAIIFYRQKVSLPEIIRAIISVGGVVLFFIF